MQTEIDGLNLTQATAFDALYWVRNKVFKILSSGSSTGEGRSLRQLTPTLDVVIERQNILYVTGCKLLTN